MEHIMYVCPDCRKVYKAKGNNKRIKCANCQEAYLIDMNVSYESWQDFGKEERNMAIEFSCIEDSVDKENRDKAQQSAQRAKPEEKPDKEAEPVVVKENKPKLITPPVEGEAGSSGGIFSMFGDVGEAADFVHVKYESSGINYDYDFDYDNDPEADKEWIKKLDELEDDEDDDVVEIKFKQGANLIMLAIAIILFGGIIVALFLAPNTPKLFDQVKSNTSTIEEGYEPYINSEIYYES